MIPLIYVGWAFGAVIVALATLTLYEVGVDVWNKAEDIYEDAGDSMKIIAGGAGLLLLGFLFMSRRK